MSSEAAAGCEKYRKYLNNSVQITILSFLARREKFIVAKGLLTLSGGVGILGWNPFIQPLFTLHGEKLARCITGIALLALVEFTAALGHDIAASSVICAGRRSRAGWEHRCVVDGLFTLGFDFGPVRKGSGVVETLQLMGQLTALAESAVCTQAAALSLQYGTGINLIRLLLR